MKTRETPWSDGAGLPDADALAALRGWYAGLSSGAAVGRYLPERRAAGESSRGLLGRIRRQLIAAAQTRHRPDLAAAFAFPLTACRRNAHDVERAIEVLRTLPSPTPSASDDVALWLARRAVRAMHGHGIHTLADLVVRMARQRQWWRPIDGLGATGARAIAAFFAAHPELMARAQALVIDTPRGPIVPWEVLCVPHEVDGSQGTFRVPGKGCTLNATNDHQAVQAWLSLHDSAATQRAYRREAERLILWAIVERGRALSSLTTDDAIAYRNFLRCPVRVDRWVGPPRPRRNPEWRPLAGALSPQSIGHALTVLTAMYRWLIAQHYVFANPFEGVKVRNRASRVELDAGRSFTEGEWLLLRTIADGLEWSYGWSAPAAQRLRFLLDFGYATGLRVSELACARLGDIRVDERGDHWLGLIGKGAKRGKVGLPPLARWALERYLTQRGLSVAPGTWPPAAPVVASLDGDGAGIASLRLWRVMRRFSRLAAGLVEAERPATAEKLRRASPHWLRHTHASHALARGAELVTVRDNLRHASIATTSAYLHSDEIRRARQLDRAFGRPDDDRHNFS